MQFHHRELFQKVKPKEDCIYITALRERKQLMELRQKENDVIKSVTKLSL